MELVVLKSLNWGLSPMTPNAWMRMYMQILHGPRQANSHAFSLPAYSGLPFSRAMQVQSARSYNTPRKLAIHRVTDPSQ
jgi:hypothetical protein